MFTSVSKMSVKKDTIPASIACSVCGKKQNVLKRCTRCHDVFYCCRECQVKDWPTHKVTCGRWQSNGVSMESATKSSKSLSDGRTEQETVVMTTNNKNPNHASSSRCMLRNGQLSCSITEHKVTPQSQRESCNIRCNAFCANYNNSGSTDPTMPSQMSHDLLDTKPCSNLPEVDTEQPHLCIRVKANKKKYVIALQSDWSGVTMMNVISHNLHIPLDRLKLIRQGKQVTVETIVQVIANKAMFQAIGEEAENEDGLEGAEIELVMKQAATTRNQAVRSLRKTGDVIDAIFDITNR